MTECVRVSAILALAAAILVGCTSQTVRQSAGGDHAAIAETAARTGDYSVFEPYDHQLVCEALLAIRRYGEFDRCFASLKPRVEAGEEFTAAGGVYNASRDYLNAVLDNMDAQRALELGNYDEAARLAERAYQTAQTGDLKTNSDALAAVVGILTLGLNDMEETSREWNRNGLSIEALGTAALAHQMGGNRSKARQSTQEL